MSLTIGLIQAWTISLKDCHLHKVDYVAILDNSSVITRTADNSSVITNRPIIIVTLCRSLSISSSLTEHFFLLVFIFKGKYRA